MEPKFSSEIEFFEYPGDKAATSSNIGTVITKHSDISYVEAEGENDSILYVQSNSSVTSSNCKKIEAENCPKREFRKLTWNQDVYEGQILLNNLHGFGFYYTQREGQKYFYDGMFYVNKLEGYCQTFYENGSHFQGLFKEHLRFGPGILSYSDGSQDVGFWNGLRLIRLTVVIGSDTVPQLANTQTGKTKLICKRYLISLCDDNKDILSEMVENTEADNEAIFSLDIRNPRSLFFHKNLYDQQFYGEFDCSIKVLVNESNDLNSDEPDASEDQLSSHVERTESLRDKIQEMDESMQTFIAIKRDLLRRVNKCKKCCYTYPMKLSEELGLQQSVHNTANSTAEHVSSVLDDSLGSLELKKEYGSFHNNDYPKAAACSIEDIPAYICACDEEESGDSLEYLEEQLQYIVIQETFYRNIRNELLEKLNRLTENKSNKGDSVKYKMVKVNDLWAWNNEELLIQMQKHSFKHRKSEDMVNFSVPKLILGNRKEFGQTGKHEQLCRDFLMACSKGKKEFINDCLRNNKLDPNVADARGNSGVFFASLRNQQDTISVLTNFGAKLDQLNDEQLTPLSVCLLKYLSVKNSCSDWELAFLPKVDVCNLPELPPWYNIKSFLNAVSVSSNESMYQDPDSSQYHCPNSGIVDLFRRMSTLDKRKRNLPRRTQSTMYIFDLSCTNQTANRTRDDYSDHPELKYIHLTITTLLNYGANPNLCEVPYPPLVLSLFGGNLDLVKQIIKANADINVTVDEDLSCLHVAACLDPSQSSADICKLLIKYGCNPNLKTLPTHWADRRAHFIGVVPEKFEIEDSGKNALHLLCMRTDFARDQSDYFCSFAKTLLEANVDTTSAYLGHTALSLAVLSGNVRLAQYLIKSNLFNPYEILDFGMGNILTLYTLKRFENVLSTNQSKEMLNALFEVDVNVLCEVGEAENAIVFAEDADHFFEHFTGVTIKKEAKGKLKSKKLQKHSYTAVMKEHLRSLGRQTLIKQIQIAVTQIIYEFLEEGTLEHYEIFGALSSEYLTQSIVIENLQKLFQSKELEPDRFQNAYVKALLEFVDQHKKVAKKATSKHPNMKKGKIGRKAESPRDNITVESLSQQFEAVFSLQQVSRTYVCTAGLDDQSKYNVCFHCLRGKGKILKHCPRCQMIQFCSTPCNKLNLKLKTQHGCNIMFYDISDNKITEITKNVRLDKLVRECREKTAARMQKQRELKLMQEEQKLVEMWRADTYGTKFLQIKPLLDKVFSNRTGGKLSWNIAQLKGILERNFRKCPGETSLYSLEKLLLKLQIRKRSEGATPRPSCGARSTLGGSTLHSIFDPIDTQDVIPSSFRCSEKTRDIRTMAKHKQSTKRKETRNKKNEDQLDQLMMNEYVDRFQGLVGNFPVHEKPVSATKKLKKIPARYQRFIEVIGTYFPDLDLSSWLLPYVCCNDGQLYYKFCGNNFFKESYSFS